MAAVFDPLRSSAVALDVMAAARASTSALAARQQARLGQVLGAARQGSALYRERLKGLPANSVALSNMPSVGREELMARFDAWVCDPALKLDELHTFCTDPARIAEPYLGRYQVWESSGTSHLPGIFVQDARAMAVYDALEALRRSSPRPLQRWLDPLLLTERIAFVGVTSGHFASVVSMQRLRQLNPWLQPRLRCFSIMQPCAQLVDELNAFAPTVIATYPSAAALLADAATRGALQSAPREIWTGGETLSPGVRRYLQEALGCDVRNSYGASEFMAIASECSHGQLHLNSDWVILEPIDAQGHPTPPGQRSHCVLLTNLANQVQPLIRYELGDQITLHSQPCSCGSPLPVLEVQGRCDDVLVMRGLHGQPVSVLPLALCTVLEDEAGVFAFELRQRDTSTLVLRLDLPADQTSAAVARCRTALHTFAASQGLAPIHVVAEAGHCLSKGRSGKACRVVACPVDYKPKD